MTNDPNNTAEVRNFLHRYIPSVAQLEVLLLLAAKNDSDCCTAAQVSDELRSETNLVAASLEDLRECGLIKIADKTVTGSEVRYQFAPQSATLRGQVESLAMLYRERRHTVLALIYERPATTPVVDPVRAFSDAFRFRDPKKENQP